MAELVIGIGADNSGLNKSLADASKNIDNFSKKAGETVGEGMTKVSSEFKKAEKSIDSFSAKIKSLGDVGNSISGLGGKLTAGLTLPLVALGGFAVKAFTDISGVKLAFDRLNDPTLLDSLRKATNNTTADIDLMKAAVNSKNFGLPVKELGTLMEFASRRAKDTGQSVDYLVQSIVTGIGRKSPLILDNLGISAIALKDALGGVSLEAASVGQITEAVGKIASAELKKMGKDTVTLGEQFAQLKTIGQNSLVKLGAVIAPMLQPLVDFATRIAKSFQDLSPEFQKTIVIIGGIVAAIGPLLLVFGGILTALPSMIAGFGVLSTAVAGAGGALAILTGPIGLVTIGLIGIVTAVTANWGKIKPYIIDTINYFRNLYNESIVVRGAVQLLVLNFTNGFAVIKGVVVTLYEVFKSFAKGTASVFGGIGQVIEGALTLSPTKVTSGLSKIASAIVTLQSTVFADLKKGVSDTFNSIASNSMGALSKIIGGEKLQPITDLPGFAKGVTNSIEEETNKGIEDAKKKIKDKSVKIELPDIEFINQDFLKKSFDETFNNLVNGFIQINDLNLDPFVTKLNGVQLSVGNALTDLRDHFASMADFGNFLGDALNTAFNSVTDTITDSFSAIGEAIATGTNIFSAFGNALLSGIGSFLGDLGKQMVQYGVAALAMAILTKALLNPITAIPAAGAMIAAGLALSLVSGAIKGTLSKGSSSGSSSGGSYASSGGGSSNYQSSYSGGGSSGGGTVVFEISGQNLRGVLNRVDDKNLRIGG